MNRNWLAAGVFITANLLFAEDLPPKDRIIEAYNNMQLSQARQLAYKYSKLPEARLVLALCAVFDRKKQDLSYGLPELKKIYDDRSVNSKLRLQAGLAYARAAQTLQMRKGVYPIADGIDFNAVYENIEKNYRDCPEACLAVMYRAQNMFEASDLRQHKAGIILLENFLTNYKGPKGFTAAIDILLADRYIITYSDYHKAVKYLTEAFDAGIVNPCIRENLLFRIGRTYDLKLRDKKSAEKYYKKFIREYPDSSISPIVKRYLRALNSSDKEDNND